MLTAYFRGKVATPCSVSIGKEPFLTILRVELQWIPTALSHLRLQRVQLIAGDFPLESWGSCGSILDDLLMKSYPLCGSVHVLR